MQYLYAYILNNINNDLSNTSPTSSSVTNGSLNSPLLSRSLSKHTVASKIKKPLCDLYSLNAIIDKPNIELLKATFQLKISDNAELPILDWIQNDL